MPERHQSFRFTDADRETLQALQEQTGLSATAVLRVAMRDMRIANGSYADDVRALLDRLEAIGARITITVSGVDANATIDREPAGVDVIAQAVIPTDAPANAADLVDLYLAAEPDLRVYIGRAPALAGATLTVALGALRP